MILVRLVLLAVLLAFPARGWAWWDYGHETIARIAEREMTPRTSARVRALLARSALLETPGCPAGTIAAASAWPDCIGRFRDRFSYAAPWHFQNISMCRPFDPRAECPGGQCLTAQIERQARLLRDPALPMRERVMALTFLIHLVGDLHQPLHVADRGDRGGNDLPVAYGIIAGRTQLHMTWDGYLAERAISTPEAEAAGILAELGPGERAAMRGGGVTDWARESWEIGRDVAYPGVLANPCAPTQAARPVIDEAQTRRLIPLIRRQAARGGIRLARMLDESFG